MTYKDKEKQREYQREHYRKNKAQYQERLRLRREEQRRIIVKAKNVPCTDCGVSYPSYVMQFDHLGE